MIEYMGKTMCISQEAAAMDKGKLLRSWLLVWIVMTVVFLGLYHPFLFGGQMYAYTDVGADTVDQYLPVMVYETNRLREGIFHGYDLQYGPGRYTGGYLLKYLNPVNLPILLLGENHLPIALLISLYLKYVFIALLALLFFQRLLKNEKAAAVCSLLWTFSGYAVLWGQHYHFLNAILAFTAAMLGFQLYLEGSRYRVLAIPAVALLALTSYYHLYIACFFFLGYGLLWLGCAGAKPLEIVKKAGFFLLMMIPALCVAGEYLLPAMANFFSSARVGQVASGAKVPMFYSRDNLMAYLARFLSNDLIGTGDGFLGPTNYYECAILHVSILSLFALGWHLTGKHRWKTLLITLGCSLALCMPAVSRLLVFSTTAQRWTYLICFVQVIAIGFCLKELIAGWGEKDTRKRAFWALVPADLILLGMGVILYRYHMQTGGWLLQPGACKLLTVTVLAYHGLLLLAGKWHKCAFVLLTVTVTAELIAGNYACVNDRQRPTVAQWYEGMYYDGTREAVEWIRSRDDGLYRINKTYSSVDDCDSMIQDYYGLSVYNSTSVAELLELAGSFGYGEAGNHVRFDGRDLLANTMLGVKYVIARRGEEMNPVYYEQVYENETHIIYENRFWLGFGYLYEQEGEPGSVLADTSVETALNLSGTCYRTGAPAGADRTESSAVDLLPELVSQVNCSVQQGQTLIVTGTDLGMQLVFDVPKLPENTLVAGIRMEMTAEDPAAACLLTAAAGEEFDENRYDVVYYPGGTGVYCLDALTDTLPDRLRVDLSWVPQRITVSSLELILVDEARLQSNLSRLRETGVTDMVQTGNAFVCTVSNTADNGAMLCLPLIYSDRWKAFVDGQAVETVNLNGGLVGLELAPGVHQVQLEYVNGWYAAGIGVSILSIVLLSASLYRFFRRKKQ